MPNKATTAEISDVYGRRPREGGSGEDRLGVNPPPPRLFFPPLNPRLSTTAFMPVPVDPVRLQL